MYRLFIFFMNLKIANLLALDSTTRFSKISIIIGLIYLLSKSLSKIFIFLIEIYHL